MLGLALGWLVGWIVCYRLIRWWCSLRPFTDEEIAQFVASLEGIAEAYAETTMETNIRPFKEQSNEHRRWTRERHD